MNLARSPNSRLVLFSVMSTVALAGACQVSDVILGDAPNPRPRVGVVQPAALGAGTAVRTVSLLGAGFIDASVVRWNDAERPFTLMSDSVIELELTAEDVSAGTIGTFSVENPEPGGGTSEPASLIVRHPAPRLDSVSPTQVSLISGTDLTIRAFGSDFIVGTTRVLWRGVPVPTTVLSDSEMTAEVPGNLVWVDGVSRIEALTPTPGGGTSTGLPVLIDLEVPAPVISTIEPDTVLYLRPSTMTIYGVGFTEESEVLYRGESLVPTVFNPVRLTVEVPAELNTRGELSIRVETPVPSGGGGGQSNAVDVFVREHRPTVTSLSPDTVRTGVPGRVVDIIGTGFAPDASVTFEGQARSVTFASDTRLEAELTTADFSSAGAGNVVVTNPRGGGDSAPAALLRFPVARVAWMEWNIPYIGTARLDGTEYESAPVMASICCELDAAPRGRSVVYSTSAVPGRAFIREENGDTRRLTDPQYDSVVAGEDSPKFSSDGEWVYFATQVGSIGGGEIWRARTDGSFQERISPPEARSRLRPTPSTAGDRVSFSSSTLPPGYTRELTILDIATGTETPLGVHAQTSRWSPDDEWIAFIDLEGHMRMIRPDGTDERPIGVPEMQLGWGFDWSGDGKWLVAGTARGRLVLISVETGRLTSFFSFPTGGSISWFDDPGS